MDKEYIYDENWVRKTGRNRIWGFAKDPRTIFVYWEVDGLRQEKVAHHFCSNWDTLPLYLCVYDVTECIFDGWNAPLVSCSSVQPDGVSRYIRELQPGRNCVISLATRTIHNQFFSILRSNTVTLPPVSASFTMPSTKPRLTFQSSPTQEASAGAFPYDMQFDGYHLVEQEEGAVW